MLLQVLKSHLVRWLVCFGWILVSYLIFLTLSFTQSESMPVIGFVPTKVPNPPQEFIKAFVTASFQAF